jgi:hypothetical protein
VYIRAHVITPAFWARQGRFHEFDC